MKEPIINTVETNAGTALRATDNCPTCHFPITTYNIEQDKFLFFCWRDGTEFERKVLN